jgi:hypothetical protein
MFLAWLILGFILGFMVATIAISWIAMEKELKYTNENTKLKEYVKKMEEEMSGV